jgi:hypothetical protein
VHVTQNVIAYDGILYSLNSKLCPKMRLMLDKSDAEYTRESFISMSMSLAQ